MKRRNREINIFSMSALDLFASAMGAFLLIAVAALPYYLKTDKSLMSEARELKEQLQQCQQKLQQCQQQKSDLEQQLQATKDENEDLKQQLEENAKFALLGIVTKAKKIVLVVDMSGSMQSFESVIVDTISEVIQSLDQQHAIQIIGYQGKSPNHTLHRWQPSFNLETMSPQNKNSALSFVRQIANQFADKTPTREAMLEALKYPAEAVVLLSDGEPNNSWQSVVSEITSQNNKQKEIHTVAIGEYYKNSALVNFLKSLANNNNGAFVGVAK